MHDQSTGRNILRLLTIVGAIVAAMPVYALDSESIPATVHGSITREALSQTLSWPSLKTVIEANDSQDVNIEAVREGRRHFDGANMTSAVAYMDREKKVALNLAAEADQDLESRSDALRHFGLMLHCAQDFYLRSNYVELQLLDPVRRDAPYDMPLVDWSKVPEGYQVASGEKLAAARASQPADDLNKENASFSESRKSLDGKVTYFSIARDLALRETIRQWNLFEALIRARCGERSAAILAALKQAGPAASFKSEADDSAGHF